MTLPVDRQTIPSVSGGRANDTRERLEAEPIERLLVMVAEPNVYEDSPIRKGAWDEIKRRLATAEAEAKLWREFGEVAAEYMRIGLEKPPDHVFRAFQRLHGLPEIGDPAAESRNATEKGT